MSVFSTSTLITSNAVEEIQSTYSTWCSTAVPIFAPWKLTTVRIQPIRAEETWTSSVWLVSSEVVTATAFLLPVASTHSDESAAKMVSDSVPRNVRVFPKFGFALQKFCAVRGVVETQLLKKSQVKFTRGSVLNIGIVRLSQSRYWPGGTDNVGWRRCWSVIICCFRGNQSVQVWLAPLNTSILVRVDQPTARRTTSWPVQMWNEETWEGGDLDLQPSGRRTTRLWEFSRNRLQERESAHGSPGNSMERTKFYRWINQLLNN